MTASLEQTKTARPYVKLWEKVSTKSEPALKESEEDKLFVASPETKKFAVEDFPDF